MPAMIRADAITSPIRVGIAAALLVFVLAPLDAAERPYRQAAIEAARWIQSSAIPTDHGIVWPADPRDPKTVNNTLYVGTPGVVLFFLEAYRSTGNPAYLKDARAGADDLLASLSMEKDTGLYTGLAGIGFTLAETYKVTKAPVYRRGALRVVELLRERAVKAGEGIECSETTDIISGSEPDLLVAQTGYMQGAAGIGMWLLHLDALERGHPARITLPDSPF